MIQSKDPIIAFDSGMGGISVLKEMTKVMPEEDFIYFGDSVNAPYGTKPASEVKKITLAAIDHLLTTYHAKGVAIACNTATSAAVRTLRDIYPDLPLVGVEPAIKPAALACKDARVLVLATPRTLSLPKFQNLEAQYDNQARIFPLPCPGLMEFVERGELEGEDLEKFLHNLMDPYLEFGLTGIVLGCTHYPFLRKTIQKIAGPDIVLYDGSLGTARELNRRLLVKDLRRTDDHQGTVTFLNSSPDPERITLSKRLYETEI